MSEPVFSMSFVRYALFWIVMLFVAKYWLLRGN
jgi:hypothetical protein